MRGYDPAGMELAKPLLPDVLYCQSAYSAAEDADAVVIATEWEQFRALDLSRLKAIMAQSVIVDLRNIYRADEMRRAAFRYIPIGRAGVELVANLRLSSKVRREKAARNQVGHFS